MNTFQKLTVLLGFVTFVFTGKVNSDAASNLQNALESMPGDLQKAFKQMFPGDVFESIKAVAKCIEDANLPPDVCNFNTSYDPIYIMKECLNGTLLEKTIETLFGGIPQTELPFGVPMTVSKDRCFTADSLKSLITTPATPTGPSIAPPLIGSGI